MSKMHKTKATASDYEKSSAWEVWEKEPSEFPWKYPANETCLILKGHASVMDFNGEEIHIKEGDLVTFKKGLECAWKIHDQIQKRYVLY